MKLVLASASRNRKGLLKDLGYEVVVEPSNIDESKVRAKSINEKVVELARKKAEKVAARHRSAIIVAGDTMVYFRGREIGKQNSSQKALQVLKELAGRTHKVVSGVCIINTETGTEFSDICVSRVTLKKIPDDVLERYVAAGHYKNKAGSYLIKDMMQDGGFESFVESIIGSYSNTLGLPLEVVEPLIERARGVRHDRD